MEPKKDHFYQEVTAIAVIDPANPQVGTLMFRLPDGQHHYSMSRQAFERLSEEIRDECKRAPLPERGSTSS